MSQVLPLLLNSKQAASLCGVSRSTFNQWVADGRVPAAVKRDYGGWPRYSRHQLERWLAAEADVA